MRFVYKSDTFKKNANPTSTMSATQDSTTLRKVPRPSDVVASPSYVRCQELRHKSAIPLTMYETTGAYVLIVRQGVKGSATANSITLTFESPLIIPMAEAVNTNELELAHAMGPKERATEGANAQVLETYQRIIPFPKAPKTNEGRPKRLHCLDFQKVPSSMCVVLV